MKCPQCSTKLDAHVATDGTADQPGPGAAVLCFYCDCINVVDETGQALRVPSTDELREAMRNPEMRKAVTIVGGSRSPAEAYRRMFGG